MLNTSETEFMANLKQMNQCLEKIVAGIDSLNVKIEDIQDNISKIEYWKHSISGLIKDVNGIRHIIGPNDIDKILEKLDSISRNI